MIENKNIQNFSDQLSKIQQSKNHLNQTHGECQSIDERKHLPFCLFLSNALLAMLIFCSNLYYIFSWQGKQSKGIWNLYVCGYTILVFLSTTMFIGSFKKLLNIFKILDKLVLIFVIGMASFYGLIIIVDNGTWPYLTLKLGFIIQGFSLNILYKMMLLYMKWSKTRVIIYKICLLGNCSVLMGLAGYYLTVNFSLTRGYIPSFDNKIQDFMMFFLFGLFAFSFQMYSKMTEFDYTSKFKYIYQIKDVNCRQNKRENLKSARKKSIYNLKKLISKKEIKKQQNELKIQNLDLS